MAWSHGTSSIFRASCTRFCNGDFILQPHLVAIFITSCSVLNQKATTADSVCTGGDSLSRHTHHYSKQPRWYLSFKAHTWVVENHNSQPVSSSSSTYSTVSSQKLQCQSLIICHSSAEHITRLQTAWTPPSCTLLSSSSWTTPWPSTQRAGQVVQNLLRYTKLVIC